ncbi:MAG: cyclase family protein [Proteobacteria bacterium]|nr:cyclase family protein [Pseudomonadota bacterium]
MVTYAGLPGPVICDYLSREASRGKYAEGTEFQIGRIDMVANTGTYLDTPFHRYADGDDLAAFPLGKVTALPGLVVRADGAVGPEVFAGLDLAGKAVLVHTGWDRHWGTGAYFTGHPYLTEAAALALRAAGVALVGIDSHNIDDTAGMARPVHTVLLHAGIAIVEHLTNLGALPDTGFIFNAPPPRIRGMGTFPVRAHALID